MHHHLIHHLLLHAHAGSHHVHALVHVFLGQVLVVPPASPHMVAATIRAPTTTASHHAHMVARHTHMVAHHGAAAHHHAARHVA